MRCPVGIRLPSILNGPWRSLVARQSGGLEVVGSSPTGPTTRLPKNPCVGGGFLLE